jgi:glyoxylate reductase
MKVYIAGPLPDPGIPMIRRAGHDLSVCENEMGPARDELLRGLDGAHGAVTFLSSRMDAEAMDAGGELRVISNYAVGFDNIDVDEATRRGIAVTNTPGVLTDATAELALALLLAAARRLGESERFLRRGRFRGWSPGSFCGVGVAGKVLGLAGCGRIGHAVGLRAPALGLSVLYHDRHSRPEFEKATGAERVDKPALLRRSDFLSLHLPLTPETRHFLVFEDFRAMKSSAVLINTARGPVIREGDLARALREGEISAAGLDVYEEEPRVHPELLTCDNAVLLPHIGSATVETRAAMAELAAENLVAVLDGRHPPHPVNPGVLGDLAD